MFKKYFSTTFRTISRNKWYAFINIAGLSIGLATAMLIMLYVKDEISFDRFHKNANHIYRIVVNGRRTPDNKKNSSTGWLEGPRFTQHVAGIKSFVRVKEGREDIKNETGIYSQKLLHVDTSFFSVFTFPLLSGDPATCLRAPHSIVLSEDAAKTQFGTTDVTGKMVMIKNDSSFIPYKVTAVAKRCPQNSSIQFNMLLPLVIPEGAESDNDGWSDYYLKTFVVLDEKANPQTVLLQMQRYYEADAKQAVDAMIKEHHGNSDMNTYFLQPYLAMHLSTDLPGLYNASNPIYSYILSGLALFLLIIACINFVNLTVARSVKRAKEIGVRKVIGGSRNQLMIQFLGESFLLCTIAFILAIVLVQLTLPLFSVIVNKALALSYLLDVKLIAAYLALYIITGLLAGFYPALVLSGYNPVQTLYNRFQVAGKNYLQKSLVVLQFTLASFLIIATFIMYAQFNFLTKTNLGYDDNDLVITQVSDTKHAAAEVFKNELMKNPAIAGVSAKNGGIWHAAIMIADSGINSTFETVDENYLPLLKIPLAAGRNFSAAFPADSVQSVIINETFAKAAHWNKPVGETVNLLWGKIETYRVIGVIKDYHFASLHEKIEPQIFGMKNDNLYGSYYIKIKPGKTTEGLKWIQKTFRKFYPMDPYSYVFKNDENIQQYAEVEKWKQILLFGAVLTIFISCIGLFGLSVLSAEKRTKEIGIRKVLGASVQSIVTVLSTDFITLVAIALLIASPLAYIAAGKWLQNFPYRITISPLLFASAGILVLLIALFTISFQSVKAAIANPVKSLRTE